MYWLGRARAPGLPAATSFFLGMVCFLGAYHPKQNKKKKIRARAHPNSRDHFTPRLDCKVRRVVCLDTIVHGVGAEILFVHGVGEEILFGLVGWLAGGLGWLVVS